MIALTFRVPPTIRHRPTFQLICQGGIGAQVRSIIGLGFSMHGRRVGEVARYLHPLRISLRRSRHGVALLTISGSMARGV